MPFETLSFDQIVLAAATVMAIREIMLGVLPPSVVGPEGWLLRIERDEH